ncbi:hypothetical protein AB0M47_20895 [Hamadaea sp. NPDC051192]|uniref:hypothetical protein n=1 Tax=Hamadaea sp. NPDC051192 TaxID=3154940 RepID=UPI003431158E
MIINARRTPHFVAACTPCARPVRVTDEHAAADRHTITCPVCGTPATAQRIYATTTAEICHPRCHQATGKDCECGCAGNNHGKTWETTDAEALADEIHAWRDRQAEAEARRVRAHASRVRAFEQWAADTESADVVTWLLSDDRPYSDFLDSLAGRVADYRALSTAQVDGARRWIESAERRAQRRAAAVAVTEARRAQRMAAGLAAVEPLPVGKAVQVTGTVAATSIQDNQYARSGAARYRMQVTGEGWALWTTVPTALRSGSEPLSALRGRVVTFIADVEADPADPTHGHAKRPRKAALVETGQPVAA